MGLCQRTFHFVLSWTLVITKRANLSLDHDRIDILNLLTICQFLHDVMIISWVLENSTLYGYGFLCFTRHGVQMVFSVISMSPLYILLIYQWNVIHMFYFHPVWNSFPISFSSYCLYRIRICRMYHEIYFMLIFVNISINCIVYGSASSKTVPGRWAVLNRYVLIEWVWTLSEPINWQYEPVTWYAHK